MNISPTTVFKCLRWGDIEEKVVSKKTRSVTRKEKKGFDSDLLDESEVLDRIISEVTSNHKRPGIVRMVEPYLCYPRKGLDVLAEALDLTEIKLSEKKLILRNWADHVGIEDISKYIDVKKKEDEVDTGGAIDKEMEKMMKDEIRQLKLLRMRKYRRMLEQELQEPKPESKKEEEEKQTMIVDGVFLKVTLQEMLAWKRYLSQEKERQEERELRREAEERRREELTEEEQRKKDEERREYHQD